MQAAAVGSVRQLWRGVRAVCRAVQVVESHLAANINITVSINQHKLQIRKYLQLFQEDLWKLRRCL